MCHWLQLEYGQILETHGSLHHLKTHSKDNFFVFWKGLQKTFFHPWPLTMDSLLFSNPTGGDGHQFSLFTPVLHTNAKLPCRLTYQMSSVF